MKIYFLAYCGLEGISVNCLNQIRELIGLIELSG
jgi:hypothetical protein